MAFFLEALFCFLVSPGAGMGGGAAARSRQLLTWFPGEGGRLSGGEGVSLIESLKSIEDWERHRTSRLMLGRKPVVSRAARFLAGREGLDWVGVRSCWSGKSIRGSSGGTKRDDWVQI